MIPIWRFRTVDAADAATVATAPGEVALRTSLVLATLDEATRRGIRISQVGVHKYSSVAAGETERDFYHSLLGRTTPSSLQMQSIRVVDRGYR